MFADIWIRVSPKARRLLSADTGPATADTSYEPTVLVNTQENMKVVQEEIFDRLWQRCHSPTRRKLFPAPTTANIGSAAAVWTRDIGKAHRMAELLRAGTVWINCYNIFDAALPFGGYKQSGWGREMGHDVRILHTNQGGLLTRIA